MVKSAIIIPILIITIAATASGQEESKLRNEIGLSFFSLEMNGETLNHGLEPKFVFGPYFSRYFSKISWITGIEYGKNTINDSNIYMYDSYYGTGVLTELNISTGARYTFQKEGRSVIKPFLESGIFYSYSHYEGNFQGGLSGDGTIRDNTYNTVGLTVRAGFSVLPLPYLSITAAVSLKLGYVNAYYPLANTTETYFGLTSLAPIQIRLGYLF